MYSEDNLDKALDAATQSFCEEEVKCYEMQKEIHVSKIFQWYRVDFGENDVEAIRFENFDIKTANIWELIQLRFLFIVFISQMDPSVPGGKQAEVFEVPASHLGGTRNGWHCV